MKNIVITGCTIFLSQFCMAQVANFGNMYVPAGGSIYMPAAFTNNAAASYENDGEVYLAGNLTNNQPNLAPGGGTTNIMGTTLQTIAGTQPFYAHHLTVNKTNYLQLDANLYVNGTLNLSNGIVNTFASKLLILQPPAQIGGTPGNASFINGPMTWQTDAARQYDFPVGKTAAANPYQPISILTVHPDDITSFTTEMIAADPTNITAESNLLVDGIYGDRYWTMAKNGDGGARILINYANPGSGIGVGGWTPLPPGSSSNVAVASWRLSPAPNPTNTGYWAFTKNNRDFSNAGPIFEARYYTTTGPVYSGELLLSSDFNAFSIGHASYTILPFTLLTFDATLRNTNDGWLQWTVADDGTLASFELQHSNDGNHFALLSPMASNGGSKYSYLHRGLQAGIHYYRLQLKGKDGKTSYSAVKTLAIGQQASFVKGLRQTVVGGEVRPIVFSASNQTVKVMLYDAAGRLLASRQTGLQKGLNEWAIATSSLASGVYFVHIATTDGVSASLRFLKK